MSVIVLKPAVAALLFAGLLATSSGASAGILEDYQQAYKNLKDGKRPCETIPYPSLVDECLRKSEIVNNNCKIVQYRCDNEMREFHEIKPVLNDRRAKLRRLEELKKDTDKQNDRLRDLKNANEINNVKKSIESNERETYDLKRAVDVSEREIDVRKDKIGKRIEWAKRCIDNRDDVIRVFESTISKAKSENADKFRSMRDELLGKWEPSVKEHDQPKGEIRNGIGKCEEMRDYRE